ncbi:uncharacterized protein LOC112879501 isoform X2 [Panicum hallii]|uniref:uncharacterized protein LOC112879501 isoform X2 n=1 Tax=Panicum hallii TaxID=206008 RepID=UPI000DF4D15D|nr:uncharacterized protein LOC112879501 isoform X2 [Panicum hallii]
MYPIEKYLRTLKGYVRNKAQPEGSIAEGYISKECMTFCSCFLEDIDTKLNRPAHHESSTVNEPPAGLSIFGSMLQMRHYILSNYDEAILWINEHKELMRRASAHDVDKRHREHFVGWFERKGPHYLARDFPFRIASTEVSFSTQNSGVLVKGDDSTGNMDWYGALKKIVTLDFPGEKRSHFV